MRLHPSFPVLLTLFQFCATSPVNSRDASSNAKCRQTKVAILGAGAAGITAGQALTNASVDDFLILEYNADIGGRVAHTTFGKKADGSPYTIELGANWVQGIVSPGGPENPIWTLAKKYHLQNTYSNYSSIQTFTQNGAVDYSDVLDSFDDPYATLEQDAGYILTENLQDRSVRTGLSIAGWNPARNPLQMATEWWLFDWEYAYSPEESSQEFSIVNYNTTFYQYSEANNYVWDQRGFSTFIKGLASTYLKPADPRLLLSTIVTNITYTPDGVTIHTSNASNPCIQAAYAITTFSLGVLQNATTSPDAPKLVTFSPTLPDWKLTAIHSMSMGTYTKIFLQFPPEKVFWDKSTQFFLYADPHTRGYYPVWQSLDSPNFLSGSGILFVTVVTPQSSIVESQSDAQTKSQVLAVLRSMFGAANVPDPTAFFYPRWGDTEWARGSYSNWPPSLTLEMHQNLRANVDRLWFAGEATHPEYYGFLQAAYFEGQRVGAAVAGLVKGTKGEGDEVHYEVLHRTTPNASYDEVNGWEVSSFLTYGDV